MWRMRTIREELKANVTPGQRTYMSPGFVENYSMYEWFEAIRAMDKKRRINGDSSVGLRKLKEGTNIRCEGGYCKRHRFNGNARYETTTSYLFCDPCAKIWAAKVEIGCRDPWPN